MTYFLLFLDGIIMFLILSRCHYGIQDFFNPLGDILMMASVGISRWLDSATCWAMSDWSEEYTTACKFYYVTLKYLFASFKLELISLVLIYLYSLLLQGWNLTVPDSFCEWWCSASITKVWCYHTEFPNRWAHNEIHIHYDW